MSLSTLPGSAHTATRNLVGAILALESRLTLSSPGCPIHQTPFIDTVEEVYDGMRDKCKVECIPSSQVRVRPHPQSLAWLDYLQHSRSESVVLYSRDETYVIRTLSRLQYIDDYRRSQGAVVPRKAKGLPTSVAVLLRGALLGRMHNCMLGRRSIDTGDADENGNPTRFGHPVMRSCEQNAIVGTIQLLSLLQRKLTTFGPNNPCIASRWSSQTFPQRVISSTRRQRNECAQCAHAVYAEGDIQGVRPIASAHRQDLRVGPLRLRFTSTEGPP